MSNSAKSRVAMQLEIQKYTFEHLICPFLSSLVRLYWDFKPFYAWFSMINPAGLLDTNMSAFISISKITEAIL